MGGDAGGRTGTVGIPGDDTMNYWIDALLILVSWFCAAAWFSRPSTRNPTPVRKDTESAPPPYRGISYGPPAANPPPRPIAEKEYQDIRTLLVAQVDEWQRRFNLAPANCDLEKECGRQYTLANRQLATLDARWRTQRLDGLL